MSANKVAGTAGRALEAAADAAANAAGQLVEKGRRSAERLRLENRLGRVQKRLGMLYYTQHRGGPSNEALAERYMDEIDGLVQSLSQYYAQDESRVEWRATAGGASPAAETQPAQGGKGPGFVAAAGQNYPKSRAFVWFSGKNAK